MMPGADKLLSGTLEDWSTAIRAGRISRAELVAAAVENSRDPAGEGRRVFTKLFANEALELARSMDDPQRATSRAGPLSGLPVSVKDLFDIDGQVTTAGSIVLSRNQPAPCDAAAVARLRAAGAVIVGRTNMTEFAYSGLGLNPHYGTPGNPSDRSRIPGGSSSGAAVSVADGMALAALGSDTGGSLRIPAAFCGLVGFKPTQSRMPMAGAFPLSQTLDTIGPIARSVACCAAIDGVLGADVREPFSGASISGLRFGVPDSYLLDDLEPEVASAFDGALADIEAAGGRIVDMSTAMLAAIPEINRKGGFAAFESFARLGQRLQTSRGSFDPRVAQRIAKGAEITQGEFNEMIAARRDLVRRAEVFEQEADFLVCPTVPIRAPSLDDVAGDDDYARLNLLVLRNPSVANLLDRPAISIPCRVDGGLPIGLMLIGCSGDDRRLLSVAAGVERALAGPAGQARTAAL